MGWGELVGHGLRAVAQAFTGESKKSIVAAAEVMEFQMPDTAQQNQWLTWGLNPPVAEDKGVLESWGEVAQAEFENMVVESGGQQPQQPFPQEGAAAPQEKRKVAPNQKNRSAFKKLAPYRPPVVMDQAAMMAQMMANNQGGQQQQQQQQWQPQQQQQGPPPDWGQQGGGGDAPPQAVAVVQTGSVLTLVAGMDEAIVTKKITDVAKAIIGDDEEDIEVDTPLMQAGITSNTAVILRDQLSADMPGVNLPPTLMFDYPSISAITEFIMEKVNDK